MGPEIAVQMTIDRVRGQLTELIATLEAGFTKMKSVVLDTVAAFRPFEIEMFTRAVNDLKAVFGTIFLPILKQVTAAIRQIADYFYSLPDSFKSAIRVVAVLTLAVGGIAAVFGALLPLFFALTAALAFPVITAIVGVLAALGAALAGLVYLFSRTEGGARFFQKALQGLEEVFQFVQKVAAEMWRQLRPAWEQLQAAFSDLGDALSELFNALKPILGGAIIIAFALVKIGLEALINLLTILARVLTGVVRIVEKMIESWTFGMAKLKFLDEVQKDQRSAFGLGTHGGGITDAAGAFSAIQADILRNAGAAEQKAKEEKMREDIAKTAENTGKSASWLEQIAGFWTGGGLAGQAARNIFRRG